MKFTVFGSRGFIGSHLTRALTARGYDCVTPARTDTAPAQDLGHAIWAIGLTADFRQRPIDTVRAHVAAVLDVLDRGRFESFLYLSSTRVYSGTSEANEGATFVVDPMNSSDLYNLSKLMGESVCHASGRQNVRVARLSNVFGPDFQSSNFLSTIIRDAVEHGQIGFSTAVDSSKDYVGIDDVTNALIEIATRGRHNIYNVAAGANTTNGAIAQALRQITGCAARFAADARTVRFPEIVVDRIREEFSFKPTPLTEALPALVQSYRAASTQ